MIKNNETLKNCNTENWNLICHQIKQIHSSNNTDFFNQAKKIINSIELQMIRLPFDDINKKVHELKNFYKINQHLSVQQSKMKIEKDIKYINDLLLGHNQDWES
jgi:hypothetical protein